MKTTKELIIADITAKVEAKLASQQVELASITLDAYNRSVFGDASILDEVKQTTERLNQWVDAGLFSGSEGIKTINKTIAMEQTLDKMFKDLGAPFTPEYIKNKETIRKIQKQVIEFDKKMNAINNLL